jgi:RNA polymerase sigma factor (sigma-70 family)
LSGNLFRIFSVVGGGNAGDIINSSLQGIINGCIRQDRSSQYMLYKEFYSYGMAICRRYALNDYDAADILNDGFLKVFTHIEKYDPAKPIKSWIGRIITNTAIDHYRMNLKFSDHDDVDTYQHIGDAAAIYDQLAYKDLLSLVQSLSPAYRTVFNLYAIDGYSHDEIAEFLNISAGTSKSNLFKARQKLQEKLTALELRKTDDIVVDNDNNS